MSYHSYPKRDPNKNYFRVPNEIYHLGLSAGAIAVYGYLLHIEDRKSFRCHASYKTIGKAARMSANTVAKYVRELEDRHLIRTEPTTIVRARDGRKMNGSLLYNIRPIQEAMDCFHERQMQTLEETVERQRAQARLLPPREPQEPLCAALTNAAGQTPPRAVRADLGRFPTACGGRKARQSAMDLSRGKITFCVYRAILEKGAENQALVVGHLK